MSDGVKVDTVRSYSSGIVGRALNAARTNHFVVDSPSGPNEAVTSIEAFLSGISSCGVTLIELRARELGLPLARTEVTIEGTRSLENPADFRAIALRFELSGVDQAQAEQLVEAYRGR